MVKIIETIFVSVIVSAIVSKIMAVCYLKKIDKYADDLLGMVKDFLKDVFGIIGKRP